MASKQHGKKKTGAQTASHTEEMDQKTDLNMLMFDSSDDDDDGAPDEVTFEDSKASALQSMRDALQAANREKELLKEKRRKKHELFQEQKKRRLLPAEVLEEIGAPPSKKLEVPGDKVEEERSSEDDEDEAGTTVEEEGTKKTKQKYSRTVKGSYTVTTTKRPPPIASSQQKSAMDFLQNRMYGSKTSRTTSNELLSLGVKRGESNMNAMKFINKDWGYKHKANAEKFKKRWLHKQKLQSS